MEFTITRNEAFNSLEITFAEKPAAAILAALKALKFRWNHKRGLWYGFADEAAVRAAIGGQNAQAAAPVKAAKQDRVKIYYNGIRLDGELTRCTYYIDGDAVTIYARDYKDLPRDLLPVVNESDSYTDYFEEDRATIGPDHPLWKYFHFAAWKARARSAEKRAADLRKKLSGKISPAWAESLQIELKGHEESISHFALMSDPGQPTADDLARIDQARIEAENAAREAEHEKELAAREKLLIMKNEGRRMIEKAMQDFPLQEGAPAVRIEWSEHPAFYSWEDGALLLSIAAVDSVLGDLDARQHAERREGEGGAWYYKTKFTITGSMNGEPINYEGRYDLGDGDGGLIAHIRAFGEWARTHNEFGAELQAPPETNAVLQLADYLATFAK